MQLAFRHLLAVATRGIQRRQYAAFQQNKHRANQQRKQQGEHRDGNDAIHKALLRLLVQTLGIFLTKRQQLIERDFKLTIQLRNCGAYELVKPRGIVAARRIHQRTQAVINIRLPGLTVRGRQRFFAFNRRGCFVVIERRDGFLHHLVGGFKRRLRFLGIAKRGVNHRLHQAHAQRTAMVNGINHRKHHANFFIHVIQRLVTARERPEVRDGTDEKDEK
ncbi:hypothetical protein BN128_831 [Cronobacter sakazakii 696]|nr:hypothetical protein BN128_831 [Cronobacter sakazakii 696]